jgi:sec-independent protein translocase protein TatA
VGNLGMWEILLILIVALLLFGAKRLPDIGKSMGKSLREFKSATKGLGDDVKAGLDDDEDDEAQASETKTPNAAAPQSKDRAKGSAE